MKPYTKISIKNMDRNQWLSLRRSGIGGSDVGGICAVSPYSSAMNVYLDKISEEISDEDNEAMRVGRDLEEYVAQRFTEKTGFKVRKSHYMYRSSDPGLEFMIADVDRLLVGYNAGLECKTANAYNSDKFSDDEIPPHYYMQIQHYLRTLQADFWYLAVLIMGVGFKYYRIERDEELIKNMVELEKNFWYGNVIPRIIPDPDGSKACDEVLEHFFKNYKKGTAIPLVGFDEQLKRRSELVNLIKRMENERKEIDQKLKQYLGEHEMAQNDIYRVSWTGVESLRLDTQRLKEERPEVYQEFLKSSVTRRFSVKAA